MDEPDPCERFGLRIDETNVKTPIAIASMAGIVDSRYVLERAEHVGAAFIGGYSVDRTCREASREMAAAGRKEFLPDDPIGEIVRQTEAVAGHGVVVGVNIRAASPEGYRVAAEAVGDGVVVEIDAHCRQQPMVDAGAGEFLVSHPDRLMEIIRALKAADVLVSVKWRAGVAADDPKFAHRCSCAGADILHVDLMDYGHLLCKQIRNCTPATLIANNGLSSFDRMMDMFSHGADMISVARRSDPQTLSGMDAAIARYADETGWYNAPKQLCRGGDLRGLTFCCLPVKECPLIPTLRKVGMSRQEYIDLKQQAVSGTPLEPGAMTCFGSMAWCCKATSPCMLRDATLKQCGLTRREYMRQKHHLSDTIMKKIYDDMSTDQSG
jgi:TIM-barrel protein